MRLAVLVSGRGSNLKALLDAETRGDLAPGRIELVLSNRPAAPALDLAKKAHKATWVLDHRDFAEREKFDRAMLDALAARDIGGVILAGFMRILGKGFVDAWPQRIINVHPSLLPAFPGLDAPAQALAHGVKVAGCTVHFVEHGVDTGPIIAQACVPVRDDDDAESLHRRIQAKEQELLPRAARDLARGALTCDGRVVHCRYGSTPARQ